ncbi:lactoylglutathione lyase [Brochothrix campestris]|uniref:Aldoketomutase n=1 Tax=Brochothrix campestris FSL F6-1037 TaxID=1265861 RepID=W7CWL8_9LIST|nr:VOC family protein [Brochothrix campestris]EUJ41362.1 lactoylglutathione lyase [Brochothrix campestris FSL F6-1037]
MAFKMLHTCYRVKNLQESIAFYKEALDFEIVKERDFPDAKFTLVYLSNSLTTDEYELELTYNYDQTEPYTIGTGYGHIAVESDDLEATHARHLAAGFDVGPLKSLANNAASYYFITDPDGYRIEIIQAK